MSTRTRALVVLALVAVCGGCAAPAESRDVSAAGRGGSVADDDQDPASPVRTDGDDVLLSCGGSVPGFTSSAMVGGVEGVADEAEVAAALERLAVEAGIDAPPALQGGGVADAEWIVLGSAGDRGAEELIVGVGSWTADGPRRGAMYVLLDRVDGGWRAGGWGDCNLEPVLTAGVSWAEIAGSAQVSGPTDTSIAVEVTERECTSARDPGPFLHEPVVAETDDRVVVYWTSDSPNGAVTCPGNPLVRRVIELERPLGDRVLLDGSTWPATPVPVA